MIKPQHFNYDKFATSFLLFFLLALVVNSGGYSPTGIGMLIFVPVSLSFALLAYLSIILAKNRGVVFISSVIGPFAILFFVFLADFAPFAVFLGVLALVGLLYPITKRLSPWFLILLALIIPMLIGWVICMLFVGSLLLGNDFVKNTELYKLNAPDKNWQLQAREDDQGALGGNFHLFVSRRYFFGLIKNEREIYHGYFGERPQVKWLDHRTVLVDKYKLDIFRSPLVDAYNKRYE